MRRLALHLACLVVVLLPAAGAQAQAPGGLTTPNVEFVGNFLRHTDTSGAKLLDGYYYVTTERDLAIYDVKDPEHPTLVSSTLLATPGQPIFTEEDPDTNGKILLVSNVDLMVYDVSDKTAPALIGTLPGWDEHTVSCVLDCTWAYGSEGGIVDLRDPRNPKAAGSWVENLTPAPTNGHDVTEVSPGIVVTSTQPLAMLDARTDPARPRLLATGKSPGFAHANLWPHGGTDDLLLVGGEATGPGCAESESATFMTFDARNWATTRTFTLLHEFRMATGTVADGRNVDSSYCVHWFSPHATYANGGLVAIAWYEHGTRFLKVGNDGKIEEIGYYLPIAGQASDVDWISDRVAYVADYLRGVDIVKFTGDIPAGFPRRSTGTPAPPTTTPPTTRTPARSGPGFDKLVSLPSAKRCWDPRRTRVKAKRHAADPVTTLTLRLSGRRVGTARGAAARSRGVGLKRAGKLPRTLNLQIEVRTRSGYRSAGQRTYRRCR